MSAKKRRRRRNRRAGKVFVAIVLIIIAAAVLFYEREALEHAAYPREYEEYVAAASVRYGLPEALIYAVIRTESSFEAEAVSSADAMGLMQITRDTFFFVNSKDKRGDLSLDLLFDPAVNIDTGAYFLSWLIRDFGNTDTAIAAYNAGRGNVRKWLSDDRYSRDGRTLYEIPFSETKNYVRKVNSAYDTYTELYYSE